MSHTNIYFKLNRLIYPIGTIIPGAYYITFLYDYWLHFILSISLIHRAIRLTKSGDNVCISNVSVEVYFTEQLASRDTLMLKLRQYWHYLKFFWFFFYITWVQHTYIEIYVKRQNEISIVRCFEKIKKWRHFRKISNQAIKMEYLAHMTTENIWHLASLNYAISPSFLSCVNKAHGWIKRSNKSQAAFFLHII